MTVAKLFLTFVKFHQIVKTLKNLKIYLKRKKTTRRRNKIRKRKRKKEGNKQIIMLKGKKYFSIEIFHKFIICILF